MSVRIVQNSLVSGVLSPELHGRHDLKAYFSGAADLFNFVVRRTGGVRKRRGTDYLADVTGTGTVLGLETIAVPFFYDRTRCAVLLMRLKTVGEGEEAHTEGEAQILRYDNGAAMAAADPATGFETWVPEVATLQSLRHIQLGDTLFFSAQGIAAFKCAVTWDPAAMAFSAVEVNAVVPQLNNLTTEVSGFAAANPEAGIITTSKKYAVFAMKDGVFAEPMQRDVEITLPWRAGAKVTLWWRPDWAIHDAYVVAKRIGASWGLMSTVREGDQAQQQSDVTAGTMSGFTEASYAFGGTTYIANQDPAIGFSIPADTLQPTLDGASMYHLGGTIVYGTIWFKWTRNPYMRRLRIWEGAILRTQANENVVAPVSGNWDDYRLEFHYLNDSLVDTTYLTYELSTPAFNYPGDIEVWITNPPRNNTGWYGIKLIHREIDPPPATPYRWVLRGLLPNDAFDTQTFVDDNIAPVEMTGIQEKLVVGDDGMDCGLVNVWEQRLLFASSELKPFSLWFSTVGDLYNFTAARPQADSDAFSVTVAATRASRILHVVSGRWLLLFTEAGIYLCDSTNEGLSHRTIRIKKLTGIAAHPDIAPIETEDRIVFVAADARTVYEMSYDLAQDSIVPVDRSVLAYSLTESARIVATAYQRFPDGVIWCLLDDGTILSMTFLPEHSVWAWARHALAAGATDLKAIDILAPGSVSDVDGKEPTTDVFLLLEALDGEGERTALKLERMASHVEADTVPTADAACVDHAGLDPANVAAHVVTLRPETPDRNTQGMVKSIDDCVIRLRRSGSVSVVAEGSSLTPMTSPAPVVAGGNTTLVTGDVKVLAAGYFNDDGQMRISAVAPHPCEILSLVFNVTVRP